MKDVHAIRRTNIHELVMQKFAGNKSAFSRAAQVHSNHVNLLLSKNEAHRRNLGEELARRIESALGLPDLWLDRDHSGEDVPTAVIGSLPIGEGLSSVLQTSAVQSMTVTKSWLYSTLPQVAHHSQLFIAAISTAALAPVLMPGDQVLIDAGVKAYTGEGHYLIAVGDDVYLRTIRKTITGTYRVVANAAEEVVESISSFKVLGKVVLKIHMGSV